MKAEPAYTLIEAAIAVFFFVFAAFALFAMGVVTYKLIKGL